MSSGFFAVLTGLAQNVILLLSLTLLYGVVRSHWIRMPSRRRPLVGGALFGLIAIAGMHAPIVVAPGVIADARVIPVLLAGPFGGPGMAAVAAVMASAYRLWLGGAGTIAGIGTILTAGAIGAGLALRWRGREREIGTGKLVLCGIALDAVILLWAAALPDAGLARRVLAAAALPVGLFLPLGTVLLGTLLVNEIRRHDERERLILTQSAMDSTADAVFWVDAGGRIVNANPAATGMTGFDRGELFTMRAWDLDLDMMADTWQSCWATLRAEGRVYAESRYRRRHGTALPVERSSDFVEYGGREWISLSVRDITERKQAEEERARHLERERALRAEAEEANVLKDQFLATLSHELRTPLTAILGYTGLLQRGRLDGEAATHALDVIERNTRAQTRLVDELLDVSSIVLRKLRLERRPVDLDLVVRSEIEAARPAAEARALALECDVAPGVLRVSGDPDRLQQVVRNLLSNALKFTPAGGRIVVRVDAPGQNARIVVQDTGRGIDPVFLPNAFDRFRQADSSTTRAHGGLGVGLAIVRHLVELHDGHVRAESDGEGKGATFTVTLPLHDLDIPVRDAARTEHVPEPTIGTLPDLDGLRVLLVEDEADTLKLLTIVLSECGAKVTPAACVTEALAAMECLMPDVIVSDIAMPDADGFEFIRRLRSLAPERGGKTPAAALTAYAHSDDAARALAAGFEAHVAKPCEPAILARVVADLGGRKSAA